MGKWILLCSLLISGKAYSQALIPFSFWGPPPTEGIQLVQANDHNLWLSGTSDRYISFATPPKQGNFVFLTLAIWNGTVTNVYDNQGNTYYPAFISPTSSCLARVYGYYAMNVNTGSPFTVTIVGGNIWSGHLREYSGVAQTNALDQSNSSTGTSASATSGSMTTTEDGELIIAAQTHCDSRITSPGAGWTNHVITTEEIAAKQPLSTLDKIGVPIGTYNPTFIFNSSDVFSVGAATFKKQP